MSPDRFYISTAISYPNGRPHIGHAYEAIAADAIARFQRLSGREVFFQTGTDEHGLKMVQAARDRGVQVGDLAKEMSSYFRAMCDGMHVSYDRFIRTVEPDHHAASQALWRAMEASDDLYKGRYEGWYSVRDEAFYDEKELIDGDGGRLSPQGTPVEWTVEETWFFRLSKYQQPLLDHYAAHPEFIQPESRRNETVRFVEGGLSDLSVSRTSFDWGVKVPGDEGHVMYVWVDALTNYLTGAGYPDDGERLAKWWPADLHLVGKDIVRFHALYWPAFLMSAGIALPAQVFGHGFLLARGGEKMSKSVGNVVDPLLLAERYGVDALRYFLLREVSFGQDGSWSEDAIVTRCNADLANNFGNLGQRCLSMIAKACDGRVPDHAASDESDQALIDELELLAATADVQMSANLDIDGALQTIWQGMSATNLYFADRAPWALRKTDPARADAVLYYTAEALRRLSIMASWAIPEGCAKMLALLGRGPAMRATERLDALVVGAQLPPPAGVYPRLEFREAA